MPQLDLRKVSFFSHSLLPVVYLPTSKVLQGLGLLGHRSASLLSQLPSSTSDSLFIAAHLHLYQGIHLLYSPVCIICTSKVSQEWNDGSETENSLGFQDRAAATAAQCWRWSLDGQVNRAIINGCLRQGETQTHYGPKK